MIYYAFGTITIMTDTYRVCHNICYTFFDVYLGQICVKTTRYIYHKKEWVLKFLPKNIH